MTDSLSVDQRSALMARIGGRNTQPELRVRRMLHACGLRFRIHRRDLPGTPDIVLPRHRTAIFVHGCFWHRHPGCSRSSIPSTRQAFWEAKFETNMRRDADTTRALVAGGWKVIVVWECETKLPETIRTAILPLLRGPSSPALSDLE